MYKSTQSQQHLMQVFQFTPEWLAANRDGYMPFDQREAFHVYARPSDDTVSFAIFSLAMGIIPAILFGMRGEYFPMALFLLFFGGMGATLAWMAREDHLRRQADLRKGHVSSICGEIYTEYEKVTRKTETHHHYYLKFKDKARYFALNESQYEVMRHEDGYIYRVYYTPNRVMIVSLERLVGGCEEQEYIGSAAGK